LADGVTNFPRKSKKAAAHTRRSIVVVAAAADRFCLMQRPATGLLANLVSV
jgi:adenine-specific DNA glycosylase